MASATRYASVLGLGFGDCGKGLFVDALARRWQAHTVVRCNGGAQAGHNVVTPVEANSPARHHTFSQFSAGTLVPGVHTLLLDPMIVHPTALLVEAEALGRIGVQDALARLNIDDQCRLTTPYHQAAGRVRECLRGAAAHGTCGVGVGETVRHALRNPDEVLRWGDFSPGDAVHATRQMEKLQRSREMLLRELIAAGAEDCREAAEELRILQDETLAARWLTHCRALARQYPPATAEAIHGQLLRPGCVLFEGAQGVLLDEWRGFHPHTTWSTISTTAVDRVAARFGVESPVEHYGVMRSYLTRHGAGPLPTHDGQLDHVLSEPHNASAGWQGAFRRGHPDAVLLRYALEAIGPLSGLLVSHLDVFGRGVPLKWCESYDTKTHTGEAESFARLPLGEAEDLAHQSRLTDLLSKAQPRYAAGLVDSDSAFLERLGSVSDLPVKLVSYGPSIADTREP